MRTGAKLILNHQCEISVVICTDIISWGNQASLNVSSFRWIIGFQIIFFHKLELSTRSPFQLGRREGHINIIDFYLCKNTASKINALSPNIHIQILQTDLHTFP